MPAQCRFLAGSQVKDSRIFGRKAGVICHTGVAGDALV
jgi:hypothetical protein